MFVDVKNLFLFYIFEIKQLFFQILNLHNQILLLKRGICFKKIHQGQSNLSHKISKSMICKSSKFDNDGFVVCECFEFFFKFS